MIGFIINMAAVAFNGYLLAIGFANPAVAIGCMAFNFIIGLFCLTMEF